MCIKKDKPVSACPFESFRVPEGAGKVRGAVCFARMLAAFRWLSYSSVLGRCLARVGLEETYKVLRIVKAEPQANLADAQRGVVEQLLGR